jgi:hypothetical protein
VGQTSLATPIITCSVEMWAELIFVEFRQQDLILYLTSSPTATAQPSSTASSATSAPTGSPSAGPDTYHSKGGLSTGAKAGMVVVVVVALGALLISLAVLFVVMRSKRGNKERRH